MSQIDLEDLLGQRRPWVFGRDVAPFSYSFIMSDPPWSFKTYSDKGLKKSAQAQYTCMSLDDIKRLPVADLATPDALLWLWATWPMLPEALAVMDAWDFTYKTGGVWAKRTINGKLRWGTGFRLRSVCEPFLIGARGQPKSSRSVMNMVDGLAREHSRKPDEAYKAAERMMPDAKRIELFARQTRENWMAWGFEATKIAVMAIMGIPVIAANAGDRYHDWGWDDYDAPRKHTVKKKRIPLREREAIRGYRAIDDEDDDRIRDCKPPVRGVGSQWIGPEGAMEAATKDFMERVRYDYGETYLDMKNARGPYGEDMPISRCGRTSIGETLGQVFYRCEIIARPCKAPLGETVGKTK